MARTLAAAAVEFEEFGCIARMTSAARTAMAAMSLSPAGAPQGATQS